MNTLLWAAIPKFELVLLLVADSQSGSGGHMGSVLGGARVHARAGGAEQHEEQ